MEINCEYDLYCWIKHYWWRDAESGWTHDMWAKKWGDPLAAHQNAAISSGRFAQMLAEEMWKKGFRIVRDLSVEDADISKDADKEKKS